MATMNIFNQYLHVFVAALFSVAIANPAHAHSGVEVSDFLTTVDTTFSCNDLVHVSVNENCVADIDADEITEGFEGDFNEFSLVATFQLDTIPIPISGAYLGEIVTVSATHMPTGEQCWGQVLVEDKWVPQITCANFTIQCFETPDSFPPPTVSDNCGEAELLFLGENINLDNLCTGVIATRTYQAVDTSGNVSAPCSQIFTLQVLALPDLPKDTVWSCETFGEYPNIIQATKLTGDFMTTGSGIPNVFNEEFCGYDVTFTDLVADGCGETFTIIRTWLVMNTCTGEMVTLDADGDNNVQLIKVKDITAPTVVMPPFSVNANVSGQMEGECSSLDFLPPANISDDCHDVNTRILTPVGEAIYINGVNGNSGGFIPSPGLGLGQHTVIYEAEDECGNIHSEEVTVTVADLTAPVTICDELTNVSIAALDKAEVVAAVFDDGSYDNCCLDTFSVRRMDAACVASDAEFGPTVTFCCADVGDTVTVVFRAVDCHGNANDCMVLVEVEDKVPPGLVYCPPPATIDCEFYLENLELPLSMGDSTVLEQFGLAEFQDNCEIIFQDISVSVNIDQCQQGEIVRHWQVTDPGQNGSVNCTQTISVEHTSDWVVEFPLDVTVVCGDSLPETGEPQIFFEDCEMIAISHEDELFTVVPDACFKIARTWAVVNWCVVGNPIENTIVESSEEELDFDLDGDGDKDEMTFQDGLDLSNFDLNLLLRGAQPDGLIIYQQIIKINDPVAPVVDCDPMIQVCIFDTTCTADFSLPVPEIMDCSPEVSISAIGDLGSGTGPFIGVGPGIYEMTYQVSDQCGNLGVCQTEVEVVDCKAPTPYCKNGIVISLGGDGIEVIPASIIDAGSFDNCPGDLNFSFSSDIADSTLTLTCGELGFILVNFWVTDAAGNQDFCNDVLIVDDNTGNCQGNPRIAGHIVNTEQVPVAEVEVHLNGSMSEMEMTFAEGEYEFEVENEMDYSVTPSKNTAPLNGVTTFDLVLISKHILGIQPLAGPLEIIAADANGTNTVTTADLVVLRKLILQIETEFPDGRSWVFIDEKYSFPDPLDPFYQDLPESVEFNDFQGEEMGTNFIGIKKGDVNGTADPQL